MILGKRIFSCLISIITLLLPLSLQAEGDFLKVHDAFKTTLSADKGTITAHWEVEPGYYLYEKFLSIEIEDAEQLGIKLGEMDISPKGKLKNDEYMGEVTVHGHNTSLTRQYTLSEPRSVTVTAKFQGCAEAGLCYPPTKFKATLELPASTEQNSNPIQTESTNDSIDEKSIWTNILIFFGLGLALSLTPCVLPMIPILSGIILGSDHEKLSSSRGFGLSASYVLGMALVYTIAGLLVALSGSRLQIYMQHPYVLWPLAAAFVMLAASLLGAFEIRLPGSLHNKLHEFQSKIPGGQYMGVFIIGALSAIVVSPCVSAPLAGLLLYVAQDGDPFKGGISLFSLAMGMGAPLIILGTTGANILPKAGGWMNRVKTFFGFMMLFMAIYLVKHLLNPVVLYTLCALIVAYIGVWLGALHKSTYESGNGELFLKAIGYCFLIASAILLYQGSTHIWSSTSAFAANASTDSKSLDMQTVTTLAGLQEALQAAQKSNSIAMVDTYADWCVACKEFEHITFTDAEVHSKLNQMTLIKLDITDDIETDLILDWLDIIGPPTLLFYDKTGKEMKDLRVTGFMKPEAFNPVLDRVLGQ